MSTTMGEALLEKTTENPVKGVFFVIDGNRRYGKLEMLAEFYQDEPHLYQKILGQNPQEIARRVDDTVQKYLEEKEITIPNPDPLALIKIPKQDQRIREAYIRHLIQSYTQGARAVVNVIKHFPADNIVVYGLSLDNLYSRPWLELQPIVNAMLQECYEWVKQPENKNIAIKPVGELDEIEKAGGKQFVETWRQVEKYSNNGNTVKTAHILLAYDHGRELKRAALKAANNGGEIDHYLEVPRPIDLFIRTGGEQRLSSGPAYQAQKAEVIFDNKVYWPQVAQNTEEHVNRWIEEYTKRHKRHGA